VTGSGVADSQDVESEMDGVCHERETVDSRCAELLCVFGPAGKVTNEGSGLTPDTSLGHSVGTRMPCERLTGRNASHVAMNGRKGETCQTESSWAAPRAHTLWVVH